MHVHISYCNFNCSFSPHNETRDLVKFTPTENNMPILPLLSILPLHHTHLQIKCREPKPAKYLQGRRMKLKLELKSQLFLFSLLQIINIIIITIQPWFLNQVTCSISLHNFYLHCFFSLYLETSNWMLLLLQLVTKYTRERNPFLDTLNDFLSLLFLKTCTLWKYLQCMYLPVILLIPTFSYTKLRSHLGTLLNVCVCLYESN